LDFDPTIDPHARRFLEKLAAIRPPSALTLTVDERRRALEHLLCFAGRIEPIGRVEDRLLPGPASTLRIRLYTPSAAASTVLPALVYFHGGGLIAGSLETHDSICRSLANASGCRVVAVDYRLAPEHPFPAAIEDGYAAACWVSAHSAQLHIDPERLVIGGDSAGATLAAVVCQMAAATGTIRPALQLLLCPILDSGPHTASRQRFAEGYLLDGATLAHDLRNYLPSGADPADPRISPLRARQLERLPPACIHTAEFDPVCDEGRDYAERLRRAGVATLYRCHSGMIHLFYGMGSLIPYAAGAYERMGADIRSMLNHPGGECDGGAPRDRATPS
jgi:acetyl esterase